LSRKRLATESLFLVVGDQQHLGGPTAVLHAEAIAGEGDHTLKLGPWVLVAHGLVERARIFLVGEEHEDIRHIDFARDADLTVGLGAGMADGLAE
jgi:hypothetical protein